MQTVLISGLHCDACVRLITKKLSQIPSVSAVNAGQAAGEFSLDSPEPITAESINQALADTEYSLVAIK